jgi:hypothetical protein
MYKQVYELSEEEFAELKSNYYYQCLDSEPELVEGYNYPDDVPDDVIYEHYAGTSFVEEDFFCNIKD